MGILWGYHRVKLPPSITQLCAQSSGVTCARARCWNLTEERHGALQWCPGRPGSQSPDHLPPVVRAPLVVTISDHSTPLPALLRALSPGPWSDDCPSAASRSAYRGCPTKINFLNHKALRNKAGILAMSLKTKQLDALPTKRKENVVIKDIHLKGYAEQHEIQSCIQ